MKKNKAAALADRGRQAFLQLPYLTKFCLNIEHRFDCKCTYNEVSKPPIPAKGILVASIYLVVRLCGLGNTRSLHRISKEEQATICAKTCKRLDYMVAINQEWRTVFFSPLYSF